MWKSGFGLICGFSGCASCRAGKIKCRNYFRLVFVRNLRYGVGSGPPNPLRTDVGADISISAGRGNYFLFWFFGVLRPSRLCDLRIMALIYGRRLELAGPRYGNRLADGRMATYVTLYIRIHNYLRS